MYIRGKVGFRPIEERDLELLRVLHNEMSTLLNLGNVDMVSSQEQLAWWKSLANSSRNKRFTLFAADSGEVLGMLRISNIETDNRNCELGLDIISPLRGRGYGRASYLTVLEYVFRHWNMHMAYVRVANFNEKAKNLYRGLNFEETGTFKEYMFRDGKYWNYDVLCMTRDDYMKRHGVAGPEKR